MGEHLHITETEEKVVQKKKTPSKKQHATLLSKGMGSTSADEQSQTALENALVEAAKKIRMAASTDQLIISLENADGLLVQVWQRPPNSTCNALLPLMEAVASEELLRHKDLNVQVTMASCFSEISRISAPDPTYSDDLMKEVFRILMVSFRQLSLESGRNYVRALDILKTAEEVKLPLMLLDIGPEELIPEMFQIFLNSIRPSHPPDVFKNMETIITTVIKESYSISFAMLWPLLESVKMENKIASPSSWELGCKVFEKCSMEIKNPLRQAMKSKNLRVYGYAGIVSSLCQNKFNKVSHVLDLPAGENSDGKDIARSNVDAGAPSIQKGSNPKTDKLKESYGEELINSRIKVWWPIDQSFYTGTVVGFDPAVEKHKILYDDDDDELLNLKTEVWEFVDELPPQKQQKDQTSSKDAGRTGDKAVKKRKKQRGSSSSKGSKNGRTNRA